MESSTVKNETHLQSAQQAQLPSKEQEQQPPLFPVKYRKFHTKKDYMEFCTILKNCQGLIAIACRKYGISRPIYYQRYENDPVFREMVDYVNETIKDFGEAALLKKIKDGDTAAIIFYAKTKLKDRGYVERQEVTGKDGSVLAQQTNNFTKVDIDLSMLTIDQRQALLALAEANINKKE